MIDWRMVRQASWMMMTDGGGMDPEEELWTGVKMMCFNDFSKINMTMIKTSATPLIR